MCSSEEVVTAAVNNVITNYYTGVQSPTRQYPSTV